MTPMTHADRTPAPVRPVEARTTRRDGVVSVLLALCNVSVFGFLLLEALIWGPEQLFGEYSRTAGHQAVTVLALILVAALAWGVFFASYTRAGAANVLGFVVVGAAVALAVTLLVDKTRSLGSGRPDAGLPDADTVPWMLYASPAAWAVLAALGALALRRPRVRWVALLPIAVVALDDFSILASKLAGGGVALFWMLVLGSPLLTAFLMLDVVFPDRTRAGSGRSPL